MKNQVIVIHGGDTFDTYEEYVQFLNDWEIDYTDYQNSRNDWKKGLPMKLGDEFEVIAPSMPSKINAKYREWKIWFEKFIPHFQPGVTLIGHSLGGTFLVKYLAENTLPVPPRGVFLVAPCYDDEHADYSLDDFVLPENLNTLADQCQNIFIYHSSDDPVVPFLDIEKYRKAIPRATIREFTDRGHFNQEDFPELIADLKHLF